MAQPYYWFDHLDQLRRAQGKALDRLGLGPQESPFCIVFERPGLRLRRYGTGTANRSPLLLVPAPIKRSYIWDLSPERSVVRRALEHQFDVYLVEWSEPEEGTQAPGLADYAGSMLDHCIAAIRAHSGADKIFLAGHSLGGVFTALHSAYQPEQVAGLVLIDVPLHFAAAAGVHRNLLELDAPAWKALDAAAHIPGSLLGMASTGAQPGTFCTSRYLDCVASIGSRDQTITHWRVERWTLDELAMSCKLFNDVMEQLYRHDRFMRGELMIEAVRLHPHDVTAPLFSVYHASGGVVPSESVLAFHRAAGSTDKELVAYFGDIGVALQHVGPLVGDNAHRHIWPRVFAWLERIDLGAAAGPARPQRLELCAGGAPN